MTVGTSTRKTMGTEETPPLPQPICDTSKSMKVTASIALARPSASVILISPSNQVLLLHRVQTSSTFPSAHVFPGGIVEQSDGKIALEPTNPARHMDNEAYRTGAIRELFEESGILLARRSATSRELLSLSPETRAQGRLDIHRNKSHITSWLSKQAPSAVLDTASLTPFTRWITPASMSKRFTTQVYIYFLPTSTRYDDNFVATPDNVETMAPEWCYATQWIARCRKEEIILHPTQFLLLHLIHLYLDKGVESEDTSTAEIERRRQMLRTFILASHPPWMQKTISPTAFNLTWKDGRTILVLDQSGPELDAVRDSKGDDEYVILTRFIRNDPREMEIMSRQEFMQEQTREALRTTGRGKL